MLIISELFSIACRKGYVKIRWRHKQVKAVKFSNGSGAAKLLDGFSRILKWSEQNQDNVNFQKPCFINLRKKLIL